ncbi:histone acetyltransferase [Geranomyces michiganensis]|nr:histone acetyltransferase [Geranomyces michiganensis]
MIQFLLFCHLFAKFMGWTLLPITDMEHELADGKSPYVVSVIVRLLTLVNGDPRPRLSNWEELFRGQMAQRHGAIEWPRDVAFAQLDISVRMQLLCELSEWVLEANKKQMRKVRPPRLPLVAVERVASQRKCFFYYHFSAGGLSQRLYCHITDYDADEHGDDGAHDKTVSEPPPKTDSILNDVYHLVASTERSWASFLHKALSSRVPAHLAIRPAFLKLQKEIAAAKDLEAPKAGPQIPAEAVMHELEEAEATIIREELQEEQAKERQALEEERHRAADEAARLAGVVSMAEILSPRVHRPIHSVSEASEADEGEIAATLLALQRDVGAGATRASGAAVDRSQAEQWSIPTNEAAAKKEENLRIRKAMAHQLWTFHRDVEEHAAAQADDADETDKPLWTRLTNQLVGPAVPDGMDPRLWLRNLRGVRYDPALLSRSMDHVVKNTCKHIVDNLKRHPSHEPFFEPVDVEAIPEYTNVVRQPMELKTIYVKILLNNYSSFQGFLEDMYLIFDNCKKFNTRKADIVRQCLLLELKFLEICCALGVAIGHDGRGLNKSDPLAIFAKMKASRKTLKGKRNFKEKLTRKEPRISKEPQTRKEKHARGRPPKKTPVKTPSVLSEAPIPRPLARGLSLFELKMPVEAQEAPADFTLGPMVPECDMYQRRPSPSPALEPLSMALRRHSMTSQASATDCDHLQTDNPLPPPPPEFQPPALEQFTLWDSGMEGLGAYSLDGTHFPGRDQPCQHLQHRPQQQQPQQPPSPPNVWAQAMSSSQTPLQIGGLQFSHDLGWLEQR